MPRKIDKIMQSIALPVIALAAVILISGITLDVRSTSEQNNAYVRVINCILSYPATDRTQLDIERCYVVVEKELNVTLTRYDNSSIERSNDTIEIEE